MSVRTDDAVVCSELVYKAYEPTPGYRGLNLPLTKVLGRPVLVPNDLVKVFAEESGSRDQQLDFVLFLDGVETERRAYSRDASALSRSYRRSKWDIAQK